MIINLLVLMYNTPIIKSLNVSIKFVWLKGEDNRTWRKKVASEKKENLKGKMIEEWARWLNIIYFILVYFSKLGEGLIYFYKYIFMLKLICVEKKLFWNKNMVNDFQTDIQVDTYANIFVSIWWSVNKLQFKRTLCGREANAYNSAADVCCA